MPRWIAWPLPRVVRREERDLVDSMSGPAAGSGPVANVVRGMAREGYSRQWVLPRGLLNTLGFPGAWRTALSERGNIFRSAVAPPHVVAVPLALTTWSRCRPVYGRRRDAGR